jgi:hypothetical protein
VERKGSVVMSKRTLLNLTFAAAALAPTLPQAQVYFWRDSHNIANYAGLCPVGVYCGVKPIRLHNNAAVASAAGSGSAGNTTLASNTPEISTAPMNLAGLGGGGMGGASGSAGGGGAISGGGGGGGGVASASASLQTQPRAAPATSTPSTPAPTTPSAPQPMVTAPSDAQSTVIAASTPTASSTSSQLRSPIGTNLDGIAHWSPQIPFVDVMKSSSPWISGDASTWDNGKAFNLDTNGWVRSLLPGQVARKLMLREFGDRYPGGRYIVRYRGSGRLSFAFAAKVISQKPGEMQIDVTPSDAGVYVSIDQTDPANYLRDIEVIMPGGICDGDPFTHVMSQADCGSRSYRSFAENRSILFYPVFANRLRAYSVLRFMDWMATNNSPVNTWSERTPISYSTWMTASGAPVEVMIALANLVGAHPWFTLPHRADDTYVENFAQLVKANLDPALSVYVENSNEVWNPMFAQWGYFKDQAQAQRPASDNMQYHALRSRTIGRIFKTALGESRVIAVLGAQAANPWTATQGLDFLRGRYGASTLGIEAVAIAPYLAVVPTPAEAARFKAMTLDDFFVYARTSVLSSAINLVSAYRAVAERYKVRLIAYEGGQHMLGVQGAENDVALNVLFDAFNRDPRIKQVYLDYLAGWKQAGGELFVHFSDVSRYTKWGRWGALEYIAQPRASAPKFDAIETFIEQNPVWWNQ